MSTQLPTLKTEDLTMHEVKYLSPQQPSKKDVFLLFFLQTQVNFGKTGLY